MSTTNENHPETVHIEWQRLVYTRYTIEQEIGVQSHLTIVIKYTDEDESNFCGINSKISIKICEKAMSLMLKNFERKILL